MSIMGTNNITDAEFECFRDMIYKIGGVYLSDSKKALVSGRLSRRLKYFGLDSFHAYYKLIESGNEAGELQIAVDLLTTNETYFFREPKHFDFLRERILPKHQSSAGFRVWSAASSSGEEAYTLAMILDEYYLTNGWEIVASDISTRVLKSAQCGQYTMERAKNIPGRYLKSYCLRGIGSQEGTFLIDRQLRSRVSFKQVNLNAPLPDLGLFDVIFLRNVLIYFNQETKQEVVSRVIDKLKPGGYLIVGHSESLNGITAELDIVVPSIYRMK